MQLSMYKSKSSETSSFVEVFCSSFVTMLSTEVFSTSSSRTSSSATAISSVIGVFSDVTTSFSAFTSLSGVSYCERILWNQ